MSVPPERFQQSRRARWLGRAMIAGLSGMILLGLATSWIQRQSRQRAERQHAELGALLDQANQQADEAERVIVTEAIAALARNYPAVAALRDAAGQDELQLSLLRPAPGSESSAHGAVVWSRQHGRGVLVLSRLPQSPTNTRYVLAGRHSGAGEQIIAHVNSGQAEGFDLPSAIDPRSFSIRVQSGSSAEPTAAPLLTVP